MTIKINIILVGIKNSGNLGSIARLCHNFGVINLILIDPVCEIDDIAYERAIKGRRYLDNIIIREEMKDISDLNQIMIAFSARVGGWNNMTRTSFPISSIDDKIYEYDGSIGLVFGREDSGLTNEEIDVCDYIATIPTTGKDPVLNISHAVGLGLYEITKKYIDTVPRHFLLDPKKKEALLKFVNEILPHIWIEEENHRGIEKMLKALIGRALMTEREANALVGLFRAILRSLEVGHPPWDDCEDKN